LTRAFLRRVNAIVRLFFVVRRVWSWFVAFNLYRKICVRLNPASFVVSVLKKHTTMKDLIKQLVPVVVGGLIAIALVNKVDAVKKLVG
jgi:hypothetical protein